MRIDPSGVCSTMYSAVLSQAWASGLSIALLACTTGQESARNVPNSRIGTSDAGNNAEMRDAGQLDRVPDAGDIRDGDQLAQSLGAGIDACPNEEQGSLLLELVPEFVTVFEHSTSPCAPLGTGVLIKNPGTSPLRIDGLSINSTEFGLMARSLPVELPAGEAIPVRIFHRGNEDGSSEVRLTVATSGGCRGFRVGGLRTSEALVTRSDEVIDFGRVAPGGISNVRRLSVLNERSERDPQTNFAAFNTDPAELFEIVSATSPETQVNACETRDVEVRFHAPNDAGTYEGVLAWRVIIELPEGAAEGTMTVPLYATVGE